MSYITPDGKMFRVADLDVDSRYCSNTIILFKENLNDYRLIFHLSKNDEYFVLTDARHLSITLRVDDSDAIYNAIELYDYNLGCLVFDTNKEMFTNIADEHTKYTCTLNISIYTILGKIEDSIHLDFKIPIMILPGNESEFLDDDRGPKSKVDSYYVTGGKHSKSANPPFSDYINYKSDN